MLVTTQKTYIDLDTSIDLESVSHAFNHWFFEKKTSEKQSFIINKDGDVFVGFSEDFAPVFVAPEAVSAYHKQSFVFLSKGERDDFINSLSLTQKALFSQSIFVATNHDMMSDQFDVVDLLKDKLEKVADFDMSLKSLFSVCFSNGDCVEEDHIKAFFSKLEALAPSKASAPIFANKKMRIA